MKFILLISIIFSNQLIANETKKLMHEVLDSIIALTPLMSSDLKFNAPDNEKEINLYLNRMLSSFTKAKHLKDFNKKNFSPSYVVIKDHLEQTIDSFNHYNKDFARLLLSSTTSICLSCHTQISKDKMTNVILSSTKTSRENFASDYEYANFQFLIRNYKQAISYYKKSIAHQLKAKEDQQKINQILGTDQEIYDRTLVSSFKNILTIYAKVLRSPQQAINLFNDYLKNKNVPHYMTNMLTMWSNQLNEWKGNTLIQKDFKTDIEFRDYLNQKVSSIEQSDQTIRSGKFDIALLINAGVLSNYLNTHPETTLTPEILYWLGITENHLEKNQFFAIGDLYLKECIRSYPKNKMAKKCFEEYKDEITFRFTGSIGTNIPKSKLNELKELENLINL